MRIPEKTVQEILRRARIEDIVGEYVQLTRRGDRLWGLSPFKTEKTPSFTVRPDKGLYYCFSTQKGGGVANFIMEMEQLSYPEALTFLAKKLGIEIDAEDGQLSEEFKHKKALGELYNRLSQTFHHVLLNSKQGEGALEYLRGRGLDDATIAEFRLGFAPDDPFWLFRFLEGKSYTRDFLAGSGLFGGKNKDWSIFHGRVIFPIFDLGGDAIAFGGRLLSGDGPKYLNSPETPLFKKGHTLYALDKAREHIKKAGMAIICEGYMDAIALHAADVKNAVAPLGTAFTSDQAQALRRFAPEIALLFDSDQAGIAATMKNLVVAEQNELKSSIIEVPAGAKDPADILKESGSQTLRKIVESKLDAFSYLLRKRGDGASRLSPEAKESIVRGFFPFLASIQSQTKLDAYISDLADVIDADPRSVRTEFDRRLGKEHRPKQVTRTVEPENDPVSSQYVLDLRIMVATYLHADLYPLLRSNLAMEDLRHPWARELYIALEEGERNAETHAGLERIDDEKLRSLLQEKMLNGEFDDRPEALVRDGIQRIKERNLNIRREQINYQLRRLLLDPLHDTKMERGLLEEQIIIDEALKGLRTHIDAGT